MIVMLAQIGPGPENVAGGMCALFAVFAVVALLIRMIAGSADESRIAEYIRSRGGRIVSVQWSPFGRGWFGEKNDRIYEVVYYDADGRQHFATCKTSLFSGVYWTEDRVAHSKPAWYDKANATNTQPLIQGVEFLDEDDLREENRRLRQELARVNNELKDREQADERD